MRRDAATSNGLSYAIHAKATCRLVLTAALLASCRTPSPDLASPGGRQALARQALAIELVWRGKAGEHGEYFLRDGRVRVRVATRRRGPQPIFDAAFGTVLAPARLHALARAIESSGVFTLPERVEDVNGRADSLRLTVELYGRRLELRSRRSRAPAIDRVLAAIDEELDLFVFDSLLGRSARRSRPALAAQPRAAFELHRHWLAAEPSRKGWLLDLWLLAHDVASPRLLRWIDDQIGRDDELRSFRDELRDAQVSPLR